MKKETNYIGVAASILCFIVMLFFANVLMVVRDLGSLILAAGILMLSAYGGYRILDNSIGDAKK